MAAIIKRLLQAGERIRVLAVDDSVVIRRLVTHALEQHPAIEVVGTAANGVIALQKIPQVNPDVLTLDIEMPEMDGLETLRRIRREYPHLRVIMFSTLTERGGAVTLEALSLGADDYVAKASNEGSLDRSMARLREELVPKIKQFFHIPAPNSAVARPSPEQAPVFPPAWRSTKVQPKVVAIGVSTGGPTALSEILPKLPAGFPLPVLVVQHMPPLFTRLLAERLHSICQLPVEEGSQGALLDGGRILVAPGDFHMKVSSNGKGVRVDLDQSPPQNSCRPAVDALFASVGEVYGGAVIAVILTGMGQDGLRGTRILKAQGASVLAQDEASSVVWGMPGAVVNAGLTDRVLPLDQIVPEILRMVGRA
ncbi:MAG: chemotaxis response regulator protein-glutamate methylesterase [Bryobacteraceae bacterium]|nr:chemotaxis response regulator protein-glutamate methylesterase [Bryobacterales bacterium]MEB2363005.1 chemotaxis response regulator protein-glutamate methylesterase [Bryobacterales bacterium]NUN02293.1 chemotaxis response regulator protein-glutamate methylesterase [Bryobacteraceae bacterium]